ncbi:hypothetical protein L3Y25_gp052 [Gordonia phage Syleon]|uniref:Uncharacterized protein n=1 Tax=Gordonia phage Syleon TaxID=2653718 RepID=A0A5Q2WBD7_9CAUD|nr:hypothetical protein L3Y25_gp052 [Gordonia phage Syleon]QGH75781.1 hypothetical protein SEA_SYLEON_52 [Gordonia phage Syleon]
MPASRVEDKADWEDRNWNTLVAENAELKAENRRLREQLDDPIYSIFEVAKVLEDGGYHNPHENTWDTIEFWALLHPDWWDSSLMNEEGRRHARLTRNGIMFTELGIEAAKAQYLDE